MKSLEAIAIFHLVCGSVVAAFGGSPIHHGTSRLRPFELHMTIDRRHVLTGLTVSLVSTTSGAAIRPVQARDFYLSEPTDEFKESEKQRAEFRQKQLSVKKKFTSVLDRLSDESKTEEQLVKDLEDLRGLVVETGGLPLGIQKEGMYKQIRTKKAAGFWPTNVEIAYQSLKSEISYQQSPNTEKDVENPL